MSSVIIEVKKNSNENNQNMLRRFSRRVQEAGIISKVKGNRYAIRTPSKITVKRNTLKRLVKRATTERLRKLGKIS